MDVGFCLNHTFAFDIDEESPIFNNKAKESGMVQTVHHPPEFSNRQVKVAVIRLPQKDQSSGKEYA
ncbi:hypothetical protein QUB74_23055 [Microcoleus sp. A2-C2]|uniref:hypothetical protein n=1 Tax=unclassified Microcoleus TaxID=2642155 RepID=UPI002FD28D26